jgi:cell division transport system permease protein
MSRLFFFIHEAFRALRRNAAPSMAAIVTTVTTVILLGVLIPVFQTTQAKSEQVRSQLNIQVGLYADATKGEIVALQGKLDAIPHVASAQFIDKAKALNELREELGKKKAAELTSELHENPLPDSFRITPDDASNLASVRAAIISQGPNGKTRRIAPIVDNIFDRQEASKQIAQVTSALKIVLTVITLLLIIA